MSDDPKDVIEFAIRTKRCASLRSSKASFPNSHGPGFGQRDSIRSGGVMNGENFAAAEVPAQSAVSGAEPRALATCSKCLA
jgi:hypothetical protein